MDFESMAYDAGYNAGYAAASPVAIIGAVIGLVLCIIVWWKLFTKAGEAGWKCLIPFYNIYTAIKIAWNTNAVLMTILMLIPIVNIVIALIFEYKLCASFGKGVGFFILSLFFAPIMLLILAFGNSDYIGAQ